MKHILQTKGLLFSILLVFGSVLFSVSPAVFAGGDELLTEKYFFSQEVFFIDNVDYSVNIGSSGARVSVVGGDSYYFLDEGECETLNYIKICFQAGAYDSTHNAYKAYLEVYSSTPDITIAQVADDTTLDLGDETEVIVTITNAGAVDSELLSYTQLIPSNFEIGSHSEDVVVSGNLLSWQGTISNGDSESFYYTLTAIKDDVVTLQGNASYFNGFSIVDLYSSTLSYTISAPQSTSISVDTTSIPVGESVDMTVQVTNTDSRKITIDSLLIEIPDAFLIEDVDSSLTPVSGSSGNMFSYSGDLSYNRSVSFDFTLKARYDTISEITASGIATSNGYSSVIDSSLELTTILPDIAFRSFFLGENIYPLQQKRYEPSNDKFTLEANQNVTFELYVDSPTDYYDFSEMTVTIHSDLFPNTTQEVSFSLPKSNSRKVISYPFLTPNISSSKSYTLYYTFAYTTEFGYTYVETNKQTVSVQPVKDIVIKHSFETKTPTSGQMVKVSVTAKNMREIDVYNVALKEQIPSDIVVKGPTSAVLDLTSDTTVDAFEYYLVMPLVTEATHYDIVSFINYSDATNSYVFNITSSFTLKPRAPDISLKKSTTTKTAIRGEIVDIDYVLENDEDYRVNSIHIVFPPLEKTYLVNDIEYNLDSLDAGATTTLSGIENRIYLENTTSSVSLPGTTFSFFDELGLQYFKETSKLSLKTEEGTITYPKVSITKEVVSVTPDETKYLLTLTNFGTLDAEVTLYDSAIETATHEETISIPAGEEELKEFTISTKQYRVSAFDYRIPQSYFYFSHGNDVFYGVTGDISLDIDDSDYPEESVDVIDDVASNEDTKTSNDVSEESFSKTNMTINSSNGSNADSAQNDVEQISVSDRSPEDISSSSKTSFFTKIVQFFKQIFSSGDSNE